MYEVSSSQMELFHLRILLLHVKGAKSYEDLRTVNGVIYPNYTETCSSLRLIENDNEWKTISEAKNWMMPKSLRNLFVRILMHCQLSKPDDLWNKFQVSMAEDYIKHYGHNMGLKKSYEYICQALESEGWSISNFPGIQLDESCNS